MLDSDRQRNTRVLVIDDVADIHEDFRAAFRHSPSRTNLSQLEGVLFRDRPDTDPVAVEFHPRFAFQGEEGVAMAAQALASGEPFAVVFVDMRMPPGWDGLKTIARLLELDPEMQIVLCTAYSDHSWKDVAALAPRRDNLLILKKPFDVEEVAQIANALTMKWQLAREARHQMTQLETLVAERTAQLQDAMQRLKRDLERRAETEAALRASETRLSTFFQSVRAGILVIDAETLRIVEVNPTASTLIGLPADEICGRHCRDFICAASGRNCPVNESKTGVYQGECLLTTASGKPVEVLNSAVRIVVGDSALIIESFLDVSAQRQAERDRAAYEQQARTLQRMDAIGKLAAGIAHDFNNLLTPIIGFADLLADDPEVGEQKRDFIQPILESALSARSLTQQILAFSRKQVLDLRVLDLNQLLHEFRNMLRRFLNEDIRLDINPGATRATICADKTQLHQVLLNLTINARDAMPRGGALTIATETVEFTSRPLDVLGDLSPGAYVALTMTDSGVGIPEEIMASIFEPFFTTKTPTKGTGMGLATVLGIVNQHNGGIRLKSTVGRGTTLTIYFPLSQDSPEEVVAAPRTASQTMGNERVVVVEDHEQVRNYVKLVLREHGYNVKAFANAEEALNARPEAELLLTDVVLPGMNGRVLSETMAKLRPSLRTIFMSGYPDEIITEHGILVKGTNFLQKPFKDKDLLRMLRSVLDAGISPV
jgi:PAS domain S-box-containing protein